MVPWEQMLFWIPYFLAAENASGYFWLACTLFKKTEGPKAT